jgi:hypothetical protein
LASPVLFCRFFGCSKSGNPVASTSDESADRAVASFQETNVTEIFEPEEPGDPGYHDVDTAVIIEQAADTPAEIDGTHWTAFVTLKRDENDDQRFRPYLRWVSDGPVNGCYMTDEIEVPTPYNTNCRFVKCAAIELIEGIPNPLVYIVIVYESMDTGDTPENWDIGVTVLNWNLNNFPDGPFNSLDLRRPGGPTDERWPDVAIDPDNGKTYIVYSQYESNDPGSCVKLTYVKRDISAATVWSQGYTIDWASTFNCHTPRIDVGMMERIFGPSATKIVGVAYTAQFCDLLTPEPHIGFHVHFVGWQPGLVGGDVIVGHAGVSRICLRNPVGWDLETGQPAGGDYENPGNTYFLDAGMPQIDIAPSNNAWNSGAIVFTQVVGNDNYGPVAHIWSADTMSLWFASLMSDEDGNWDDGLYPSLAWHYQSQVGSLTYFRQIPNSDEYHPWVEEVTFALNGPPVLTLTSGGPIGNPNDFITLGRLNHLQIDFLNPGAASAISSVTFQPYVQNYWAAWCDRMHMEPPPESVIAAWGNTN